MMYQDLKKQVDQKRRPIETFLKFQNNYGWVQTINKFILPTITPKIPIQPLTTLFFSQIFENSKKQPFNLCCITDQSFRQLQKKDITKQQYSLMNSKKYVAILYTSSKKVDFHPLSREIPLGNLQVGNKKLIAYQLEQLQEIQNIIKIVVLYQALHKQIIDDIQVNFIQKQTGYKHLGKFQFFEIQSNQSEYASLQQFVNSNEYSQIIKENKKFDFDLTDESQSESDGNLSFLFVPVYCICGEGYFAKAVEEFEKTDSDLTLLLKTKKQYGTGQKIPEIDLQPDYEIAMIGSARNQSRILSLISMTSYQFNGFQMHQSIYKRTVSAQIKKVIDSGFYIAGPKIIRIAKKLVAEEINFLKEDFIETLISNQANLNILRLTSEEKALKITATVYGQEDFIRKISDLKLYCQLNFESIIRGPKERKALLPNKFTSEIDEALMKEHRTALVGADTKIEKGTKIRRSCIGNNCVIGQNCEIQNSIVLNNSVIMNGVKIRESIVGPFSVVGQNSSLHQCKLDQHCKIAKDAKLQGEIFLE